ncbi:MAG: hypothetical protein KKD25_19380 [Gammaproteobacteria bacterium]|jgi:hypothetical protein|nr:hypothetical protein [Gammaproteobacteria bacterium]MBU0769888.1 hypothetical protein [Gammaproteobacteria bacterium]MBU0854693.1 hypothetical protein [Gammaproteobacteria bacterium]MBU1845434.1 hypothetical protein [Gammaproteobacteria bacterium]
MVKQTDFLQFVAGDVDPLTWYDWLPGDAIRVSGIPEGESCEQLVQSLLLRSAPDDASRLDLLTARLLDTPPVITDPVPWRTLAARLSALMCRQLATGGDRHLRMRAQRLNYCIQACVDQGADNSEQPVILDTSVLPGNKPWDCIEYDGVRWWLTSGDQNVHRDGPGGRASFSRGLPTQLDLLRDGRLSVGSIYTPGAWLVDGETWQHLDHAHPIVLVFQHLGELRFLDGAGVVWRDSPRELIWRVPCPQVHFARLFGNTLYCMDNADFGHVTCMDIESGEATRHSTAPVQVCNDVVEVGDALYLIDKQQGSVFKFSRKFDYVGRRLTFGRGASQLVDPVSVRVMDGKLRVVSWLTGRLTWLIAF